VTFGGCTELWGDHLRYKNKVSWDKIFLNQCMNFSCNCSKWITIAGIVENPIFIHRFGIGQVMLITNFGIEGQPSVWIDELLLGTGISIADGIRSLTVLVSSSLHLFVECIYLHVYMSDLSWGLLIAAIRVLQDRFQILSACCMWRQVEPPSLQPSCADLEVQERGARVPSWAVTALTMAVAFSAGVALAQFRGGLFSRNKPGKIYYGSTIRAALAI